MVSKMLLADVIKEIRDTLSLPDPIVIGIFDTRGRKYRQDKRAQIYVNKLYNPSLETISDAKFWAKHLFVKLSKDVEVNIKCEGHDLPDTLKVKNVRAFLFLKSIDFGKEFSSMLKSADLNTKEVMADIIEETLVVISKDFKVESLSGAQLLHIYMTITLIMNNPKDLSIDYMMGIANPLISRTLKLFKNKGDLL